MSLTVSWRLDAIIPGLEFEPAYYLPIASQPMRLTLFRRYDHVCQILQRFSRYKMSIPALSRQQSGIHK